MRAPHLPIPRSNADAHARLPCADSGVVYNGGSAPRHLSVTGTTMAYSTAVPLVVDEPAPLDKYLRSKLPPDPNLVLKSVPLPNSEQPGFSAIYRNMASPDKVVLCLHPQLTTLYELFEHSAQLYQKQEAFGTRVTNPDGTYGDYQWEDYLTVYRRRLNLGAGIFFVLENNPFRTDSEVHQRCFYTPTRPEVGPGQSPVDALPFVVTLYSHNRAEWVLSDCACVAYSLCSTALYDSLGPETLKYILELTQSPIIICSKDKIAGIIKLKQQFPDELANVIAIVLMDSLDNDAPLVDAAKAANIMAYDIRQVERFGEINPLPVVPPSPNTVYTISFTSGTTGANPKGVVLMNRQAVAAVTFCSTQAENVDNPTAYSFLPLAHIYERMTCQFALFKGARIGFPPLSLPLTLLEDVQLLRPHMLALVPRVYSKLEAGIKAQTINNDEKPILKSLFTRAIAKKMELQLKEEGDPGHHLLYDRLLGVLRKKLGMDRLIGFTTGSAPIAPETIKFMKAAVNCGMSQGYGLTESFAGVMLTPKYDIHPGLCGLIAVTCEMRLREIPEMGYTANDEGGPRGELLLRGPQIFTEYYKNPEETAKALDKDGWFYTGDVARIDSTQYNRIHVIDRVKNYLKLSQGEYVTPERCENLYMATNPALGQIYVHGDGLQNYLVGVLGIEDAVALEFFSKLYGTKFVTHVEALDYANKPENKRKLLQYLNNNVGDKLQSYEKLKNVRIAIDPLGAPGGEMLTPTIKIKRALALKHFRDLFDELYAEGNLFESASKPKL